MREGRSPYDDRGISPTAPAMDLKKTRGKSNPKLDYGESFKKCNICEKIVSPLEMHDKKICKECADKLKPCIICGKQFIPKRSLTHCPNCE